MIMNSNFIEREEKPNIGVSKSPTFQDSSSNVNLNHASNMQSTTTRYLSLKVWGLYYKYKGHVLGAEQGQFAYVTKLEGYRHVTASDQVAVNWPPTLIIEHLWLTEHLICPSEANKRYPGVAGVAKPLVFRTLNRHELFEQMVKRKLSAVIKLPSQILLLTVTPDKVNRLIGLLLPSELDIYRPHRALAMPPDQLYNSTRNNLPPNFIYSINRTTNSKRSAKLHELFVHEISDNPKHEPPKYLISSFSNKIYTGDLQKWLGTTAGSRTLIHHISEKNGFRYEAVYSFYFEDYGHISVQGPILTYQQSTYLAITGGSGIFTGVYGQVRLELVFFPIKMFYTFYLQGIPDLPTELLCSPMSPASVVQQTQVTESVDQRIVC